LTITVRSAPSEVRLQTRVLGAFAVTQPGPRVADVERSETACGSVNVSRTAVAPPVPLFLTVSV